MVMVWDYFDATSALGEGRSYMNVWIDCIKCAERRLITDESLVSGSSLKISIATPII